MIEELKKFAVRMLDIWLDASDEPYDDAETDRRGLPWCGASDAHAVNEGCSGTPLKRLRSLFWTARDPLKQAEVHFLEVLTHTSFSNYCGACFSLYILVSSRMCRSDEGDCV